MLYFEDLEEGTEFTSSDTEVSREALRSFARKYDPMPFHLDEQQARESVFGGLVASGIHTLALCQGHAARIAYRDMAVVAGTGMEKVKFHEPVRPDDSVSIRLEVVGRRSSGSHPNTGVVETKLTGVNQDNEVVVELIGTTIVRRSDSPDP
jgi:acyl dehydratase